MISMCIKLNIMVFYKVCYFINMSFVATVNIFKNLSLKN